MSVWIDFSQNFHKNFSRCCCQIVGLFLPWIKAITKLTVCIFFQNMFYLFFKLLTKTFAHIQQQSTQWKRKRNDWVCVKLLSISFMNVIFYSCHSKSCRFLRMILLLFFCLSVSLDLFSYILTKILFMKKIFFIIILSHSETFETSCDKK